MEKRGKEKSKNVINNEGRTDFAGTHLYDSIPIYVVRHLMVAKRFPYFTRFKFQSSLKK